MGFAVCIVVVESMVQVDTALPQQWVSMRLCSWRQGCQQELAGRVFWIHWGMVLGIASMTPNSAEGPLSMR